MAFNSKLLNALLSEEESSHLDFKRDQYKFTKARPPEKSELLKDILAFANSKRDRTAYILIGVKEVTGGRSEVVGIEEHLKDADLHEFVNSKTQKRVVFSYFPFVYEDKEIGVIEIPIQDRPIFVTKRYGKVKKTDVYIRDGSSTTTASSNEITEMSSDFSMKDEFRQEIREVKFISQNQDMIAIDDLFVFPNLVPDSDFFFDKSDRRMTSSAELIELDLVVVRGEEKSGKTSLLRRLFLRLDDDDSPVLLVDLDEYRKLRPDDRFLRKVFSAQFKGEYDLWARQSGKAILFDNLGAGDISFVEFARKHFEKVIVATSIDNYIAYFAEEDILADFKQVRIQPLRHAQQEELIRKWKALELDGNPGNNLLSDGSIDQIEREVNSIVMNRIIPRYPFFVLSILQTYEAFMPQDLRITAYGHCYHALIVAQLLNLGVGRDDMDSCFNFLGWLAHAMRQKSDEPNTIGKTEYEQFRKEYNKEFLVKDSVVNRLFDQRGAFLSNKAETVSFCSLYGFYFFLGRYLSDNYRKHKETVTEMVEKSYLKDNSLSLIFIIHHSNSQEILDDIILHTMVTLDERIPVRLDLEEVSVFQRILKELPDDITSGKSVEEERKVERDRRDELDKKDEGNREESPETLVNDIYRALKNMEVLSQILKNKYGSISKEKLSEMVETVLDTGLKLARVFLLDESEVEQCASYLRKRMDEKEGLTNLREAVRLMVFVLVISSIERAVSSINKREIGQIVSAICSDRNTPAYDLIEFLYSIDIADRFTESHKDKVDHVLRKHKNNDFLERIISWRVQHYFNTHREWNLEGPRVGDSVRQSTLALVRKSK